MGGAIFGTFLKGERCGSPREKKIEEQKEHAPCGQLEEKTDESFDMSPVQAAQASSQGVHPLRFLQGPRSCQPGDIVYKHERTS